jgi:ABC-type bacteriocin/lantibiotic exporter with double-glycine peptidase domain
MVLGYYGTDVTEEALEVEATKLPGGVFIEELARLAERHGLRASIVSLHLSDLAEELARDVFPIVYLNRAHLDRRFPVARKLALRRCIVHTVVVVGVSSRFVTVNDPLTGRRRRISKRKFEAAQRDLSYWCVLCKST